MGFQIPSYLKFLTDSNGGADAQVEGIFSGGTRTLSQRIVIDHIS